MIHLISYLLFLPGTQVLLLIVSKLRFSRLVERLHQEQPLVALGRGEDGRFVGVVSDDVLDGVKAAVPDGVLVVDELDFKVFRFGVRFQ